MDQIVGILPNIMKIVEIPGNGERKNHRLQSRRFLTG
jgi:hypothetical protein